MTDQPQDTRLIERWLPIAEIGIESLRERTPMTPFPAPNRLHVWWARRPLVASRAAILASLLPADAEHAKFRHVLGIHGDPRASRQRIDQARRTGVRFEGKAYGYDRAFKYCPTVADRKWIADATHKVNLANILLLDPTAGGGAIPLEGVRLGFSVCGNDLNPVATLLEIATVDWPARFGRALLKEFRRLAESFLAMREERLNSYFPPEQEPGAISTNYLWARTIHCPYCDGLVPLSPNWRLAPDGTGVRLLPRYGKGPGTPDRHCDFEIVGALTEQSAGTVANGDATCPFSDCGRVIEGDEHIKTQGQAGLMGEQIYAVVFKRRIETKTKTGKVREKWQRAYRAPLSEDDNSLAISACLAAKLPEWEALGLVPTDTYDHMFCDRSQIYGVKIWRDCFSPRQLLCHATSVEIFQELLRAERESEPLTELKKAAFVYLALSIDKLLNYNSRMSVWMPTRERKISR